jgi:hypothetical protein
LYWNFIQIDSCNSVIVIYEPSARRHFSHISALFYLRHKRRRRECFICANMPNTSSRIEVCRIFFETNISILKLFPIVSNLVNRWRLPKIYFHSFEIFNIQIGEMTFCTAEFIIIKSNYFRKKPMLFGSFWSTSARNLRSRLTVAFAKCHFEVSEFKKIFSKNSKARQQLKINITALGDYIEK